MVGLGVGAAYLEQNPQVRDKLAAQMEPLVDQLPAKYRGLAAQEGLHRSNARRGRLHDTETVSEGCTTNPPPSTGQA